MDVGQRVGLGGQGGRLEHRRFADVRACPLPVSPRCKRRRTGSPQRGETSWLSLQHRHQRRRRVAVGKGYLSEIIDRSGTTEYTLALGYSVSETLYTYVEAFGAGGGLQGDAGLAWRPDPLSQFDVSVGWTDGSGNSYVAVGWSKLWMP